VTTPVKDLKGITDALTAKLAERAIEDSDQLLRAAAGPAERKALAEHCDCSARDILQLANRADLARVRGIGGVYSDLLELAGVDTVKELATRRADNLHAKLAETNQRDQLTTKPPTETMVRDWIEQAKSLPRALTY
jgi:predicted flap endonuclease-1-like 5' DNA nuclease